MEDHVLRLHADVSSSPAVFDRLAMDHVLVPILAGQVIHKLDLHDFEASVRERKMKNERMENW